MDLDRIFVEAASILRLLEPYGVGGNLDQRNIFQSVLRPASRRQENPSQIRNFSLAIDMLEHAEFIRRRGPDSYIELTDRGRKFSKSQTWHLLTRQRWFERWLDEVAARNAIDALRLGDENTFSQLRVEGWRQFGTVDILFHQRVTFLVGVNGSGKTTLLNMLAPHFAWSVQLIENESVQLDPDLPTVSIGELTYSRGQKSFFSRQAGQGVRNAPLNFSSMEHVPGIFINSHRSMSNYRPVQTLPARFSERSALLDEFRAELNSRYSGEGPSGVSPLHRMKSALLAAAMYGYGNQALEPDRVARQVWEDYQAMLKRLLPAELSFIELKIVDAEVMIRTKTAEFALEAVSGGLSSILEISWQIFLRQRDRRSFTVCIDEPENHLHPELQRWVIPSLMRAFPTATFVIATHSPLVVSSVAESHVYTLDFDHRGKVNSHRTRLESSAVTANDVLTSILGLDTTLPIEIESQLRILLAELGDTPSANELKKFRQELKLMGILNLFPAAFEQLGEG